MSTNSADEVRFGGMQLQRRALGAVATRLQWSKLFINYLLTPRVRVRQILAEIQDGLGIITLNRWRSSAQGGLMPRFEGADLTYHLHP